MKRFNVTGLCIPEEHYMVDISEKIKQIRKLIDNECYFTINRARQYGKTTTLNELEKSLTGEYIVASISFEGLGSTEFASDENFCLTLMSKIQRALEFTSEDPDYIEKWLDYNITTFDLLNIHITKMCKNKKIILMIDEVDKTSSNSIFLHFIGMLRDKFLLRGRGKDYTFHNVILAGVYDIKNIKLKLINEGLYKPSETENKMYNSPWNIAIDFEIDMSFNPAEIATMLIDYEKDHNTGMNITELSEEIYSYTNGYPFLVSRICQHINDKLNKDWSKYGIQQAVKIILYEASTLFDDLIKNIRAYPDLRNFLYELLFIGEEKSFNIDNASISLGCMFGFLKESNSKVKVDNRIFEIRIYNYFVEGEPATGKRIVGMSSDIIKNGKLDMELCLRKFAEYYAEIFSPRDAGFLEQQARKVFLMYIKPMINGEGF